MKSRVLLGLNFGDWNFSGACSPQRIRPVAEMLVLGALFRSSWTERQLRERLQKSICYRALLTLSSAPYAEAHRSQQNSKISRETIQNNGTGQNFASAIGPSPPALVEKCKAKASIEQSSAGRQD
jgi:hypothetical protein